MYKRKPLPMVTDSEQAVAPAGLRKTIASLTKAELVDLMLELAHENRGILRKLTARFDVPVTADELVAATRQAIVDATAFDERDINRNFSYDYEAYSEVKRNLGRLIDAGELQLAMQLSLELMKQGSYQAEMSDESLMTEDIKDCLSVVLAALRKCDLPPDKVTAWCSAMLASGRIDASRRSNSSRCGATSRHPPHDDEHDAGDQNLHASRKDTHD